MPPRKKRVKFYNVPTSETASQIRHTSFTLASGKTFVRNSFIDLSPADPPIRDNNKEPTQNPFNCDPSPSQEDFDESQHQNYSVSLFDRG